MTEAVVLPPLPQTGGCQCGKVRYEIVGVPTVFNLCHCRERQRQISSAFGEALRVLREDQTTTGELAKTTRLGDSGRTCEGWFCPSAACRSLTVRLGARRVTSRPAR